jgi:iron complex outermembrane receptor protein
MMVVRRLFLLLAGALFWGSTPLAAQAPSGSISGRVVDSVTQQPLADVSVVIDGTRLGTVTQADGTYLIGGVPVGSRIVRARRIGYGSPTVTVSIAPNGTATANFSMDRRAAILEEVVTTGYGTQRRMAITGSISTIDADQANVGVTPNVNSLIQGRAAGVYMTQNSGEPGAGAQIRIRGGTSISASNDPLYVVDGVPVPLVETEGRGISLEGFDGAALSRSPLNMINPSDIESITILKDAAASIYGTRAANGVILIETKKGTSGGPSVEYDFYVGRSSPERTLDLLTADQYRTFVGEQAVLKTACLANPPPQPTPVPVPPLTPAELCSSTGMDPARVNDLGTANTDWEDAVTRSANTFNHNVAFSGGSANTRYRASINHMNQQGVVLANGFRRYQARLNGTHQAINGRLRLGLNMTGSQIRNDYLQFENTGGFGGGVFINMVNYNPTLPIFVVDPITGKNVYYETGPGTQAVRNPVALAEQIEDVGTSTLTLGNVSADFDIIPSLTASMNVGVNRTDGTRSTYWPRISPIGAEFGGRAMQQNRDNTLVNLSTFLNFNPTFSDRMTFDMLGGYEFSEYTLSEFGAEARNFLTDAFGYNRLESGGTPRPGTSYREESRIVGFFTRANASFMDKYFLTASVRRDGSSRFGVGNKWAVFPAISASWRISEESFLNFDALSELRLRAGWGRLGNPAVPPYASLLLLSADNGSRAVWGETAVTGVSPFRNPNPDLRWEETDQTNIALDYGFLANRFTGSLEYYIKNTRDLLLDVAVPQPAGVTNRLENIGQVRNKGLEFSLDAQVMSRPDLSWSTGLVFSRDRTTVVDLGGRSFITTGRVSGQGQSGQLAQRIIPGQPLGTFYGPVYVGVDANGKELYQCTPSGPTDAVCVNGQMVGPPRSADYAIIGDANPDFTVGLRSLVNWRQFDFSFLINSQQGADVFNNTALVYSAKSNAIQGKNFFESGLSDGVGITQPQTYSSRWIEDGSFVRLQNVTLGFTFDMPGFAGGAKGTRAYISGDNLLLMTDYSGYDPEAHTDAGLGTRGIDYLHYPRPRTITGGIRVSF